MTENPWQKLPQSTPFVLPGDAEAVKQFNKKANRKAEHVVHLALLPEPFVGSKDALYC